MVVNFPQLKNTGAKLHRKEWLHDLCILDSKLHAIFKPPLSQNLRCEID